MRPAVAVHPLKSLPWSRLVLLLLAGLVFAVRGQAQAHDFARWEPEIAAYERSAATNPPPPGGFVFTGSSTIRLWTSLARDFPGEPVINRGFGGSEVADATHFADRLVYPAAPRKVFLRAGGNDLWAGEPVDQVFDDFKAFAQAMHKHLPAAVVYYISWSPSLARWREHGKEQELNRLVAGYVASRPWLRYIETYDLPLGPDGRPEARWYRADGLHFNAAGYQLLAARVRPAVVE